MTFAAHADPSAETGQRPARRGKAEAGGIDGDRLTSIVERIERLEEERKALAADIKDILLEARSAGFDVKVVRQMLKERAMDPDDRAEWEALCGTYRRALGMLDGTPLGAAACDRLARRRRRQ